MIIVNPVNVEIWIRLILTFDCKYKMFSRGNRGIYPLGIMNVCGNPFSSC